MLDASHGSNIKTSRVAKKTTASACQSHQRGWSAFVRRSGSPGAWHIDLASWENPEEKLRKKTTKFSAVPVELQLSQGFWILKVQDSHEVDDLWQPELPYCAISRNRDMMSSTDNGGLGCNKSRWEDGWCHQTSEASKRPQICFNMLKANMSVLFSTQLPRTRTLGSIDLLDLKSVNCPHPSGSASSSCRSASSSKCAGISFQNKKTIIQNKVRWVMLAAGKKNLPFLGWPANATMRLQGGYIIKNNQQ